MFIPRKESYVPALGFSISRVRLKDLREIGLEQYNNCSFLIGIIETDCYRTKNKIPIKNNDAVRSVWDFIGALEYSDKRRSLSTGYILTEVMSELEQSA